ncbi:MAG TPA: DNA mismatch repair protein MutS [Candidatus Tripitaka californicus]|uniref:DNA mismatch repair protein MutS n=3 Tax=Candidatus Tripitaka californicus TaxID=3367616 RepID=UPI004028A250|nr:DNA mismatch repair protein MutS [Planctomycetota bacterium]
MTDLTPMMQQYRAIKERHKDCLLFFRLGDFYEMFYEDAKTASRVLGITLTSRSKGDKAVPMAGVPHHAASAYINKLIKAGYKVAICEQMEDPKEAKGVVERDIVRVLTPGTLTDENLLEERVNNYLVGISPRRDTVGLAWVELSTGRFEVEETSRMGLMDALYRLRPAECLLPEDTVAGEGILLEELKATLGSMVTPRPPWEFSRDTAYQALLEHFRVANLEGFGCQDMEHALGAAGAVLLYLRDTHRESLSHICKLKRHGINNCLLIDATTQRGLELLETIRTRESAGSLLGVLDLTLTPMGARLMRQWILSPLLNPTEINHRQEGVQGLFSQQGLRTSLRSYLKNMADMERISTRVSAGRSNARELVSLKDSLEQVGRIKEPLVVAQDSKAGARPALNQHGSGPALHRSGAGPAPTILKGLGERLDTLEEVRGLISTALVANPPPGLKEGGLIREGYHAELDELRNIGRNGKSWLTNFQVEEIRRTGISSLKVGYNKVFGYYIEVTNTHKERIPQGYVRRQTLKNAERYITPELKEYESRVLTAEERAKGLEYELFEEVRKKVASHTARLQEVAGAVAELDVLVSLAQVAVENNYIRPEITEDRRLYIAEGRHPVLEKTLGRGKFVPNSIDIDGEVNRVMVITGPNMAGKSTYIRQVALLVLMAQMGSFIPAREARMGVVDRIFTRVGASDELSRGQSTFMVEMQESANILNNATGRSLIILDEVGRGTSTFDGLSIAWALTEYIYKHLGARTLFATHYHELTELALLFPGIKNYNVAVREWGEEVVFLRKIVEGGTDKSYGIHVARLAGVPKEVITRAKEILEELEANSLDAYQRPKLGTSRGTLQRAPTTTEPLQIPLFFPKEQGVIDDIKGLDVSLLTPLEALNKLDELKKRLQ